MKAIGLNVWLEEKERFGITESVNEEVPTYRQIVRIDLMFYVDSTTIQAHLYDTTGRVWAARLTQIPKALRRRLLDNVNALEAMR